MGEVSSLFERLRIGRCRVGSRKHFGVCRVTVVRVGTDGASILLTPPPYRYLTGIVTLLALLWWSYLLSPVPLCAAARLLERGSERLRRPLPLLLLSLKNLRRNAPLRQVIRLTMLLCSLLLTIVTCTAVLQRQSGQLEDFIVADCLVTNANETLEEAVAATDGTLDVLRFSYHPEVELKSGAVVLGLSLSGGRQRMRAHRNAAKADAARQ